MNKINRRANNSCARQKFWNAIKLHLDSFYNLLQPIELLTPEDKHSLETVRFLLVACRKTAQDREEFHKHKLLEVVSHE